MAVMEFACSYDEGKLASESQSPSDSAQGMVRAKDEIDLLIKGHNLDGLTKSVLYSKKDYVAFYKRMSRPDPVFGCDVGKSGIDKRLSDALAESGITRLYEFQHTSIKKILLGKNIIIDVSGKTEAFDSMLHMACTQNAKGPSVQRKGPSKTSALRLTADANFFTFGYWSCARAFVGYSIRTDGPLACCVHAMCSTGIRNASVLPDAVGASMMMFLPKRIFLIDVCWNSYSLVMPDSASASESLLSIPDLSASQPKTGSGRLILL